MKHQRKAGENSNSDSKNGRNRDKRSTRTSDSDGLKRPPRVRTAPQEDALGIHEDDIGRPRRRIPIGRDEPQPALDYYPLPEMPWLGAALNGGLRRGASYLIPGPPGANKSTMTVQISLSLAAQGIGVLMMLNEQTLSELDYIFRRVCGGEPTEAQEVLWRSVHRVVIEDLNELPRILRRGCHVEYAHVRVLIIDSLHGSGLSSAATKQYQMIYAFHDEAKALGLTLLLVSHVTKRGSIAGPRSLEHKVDVVLMLRKAFVFRQLFLLKNRYGPELPEPIMLQLLSGRLELSPHALEHSSSVLGYDGTSDSLLEIQAAVSLPKLSSRGELLAPYMPRHRVKQVLSTLNRLNGIDLGDLSYSINAFVPDGLGYEPPLDLALGLAILAAYLHAPVPTAAVFAGQIDLRRNIRPPSAAYLSALGDLLSDPTCPHIERVYLSSGCAGIFHELLRDESRSRPDIEVISVRTLDELLTILWPNVFRTEMTRPE